MIWPNPLPLGVITVPFERAVLEKDAAHWEDGVPSPRIRYDSTIDDDDYLDETLAHEILHAWASRSGLRFRKADKANYDFEERLCNSFAPFLVQLGRAMVNGKGAGDNSGKEDQNEPEL